MHEYIESEFNLHELGDIGDNFDDLWFTATVFQSKIVFVTYDILENVHVTNPSFKNFAVNGINLQLK